MGAERKQTGPLVSVLMSTYNRPQYMRQALESILRQTYTHLEVFLIRDGGEPVRHIVEQFDDPRLCFIDRDENRGLPYSFNQALRRARGKYVCYLGDDDLFYPNHVQVLVEALEGQDRCGAAYTDLYKAHCRIEPDGTRTVLAKNVEISRDFDRFAMLQFNHILHVSLMHRRDLLEKTGLYNEKINVLVDWDLTRRMCFFTDFLHVPVVTGEFYASVDQETSDRISIRRRKDVGSYIYNLLTIRSTRPAKPWPHVQDLSIIVLADRCDDRLGDLLRQLWSHTFYPHQIYLPLPQEELMQLRRRTIVPHILGVAVDGGASPQRRLDAALECVDSEYVAVVPVGWRIDPDAVAWIEKSLWALMHTEDENVAYEVIGARPDCWAAVFRREQIVRVRREVGGWPPADCCAAGGLDVRVPRMAQWPFQLENLITSAEVLEKDGQWAHAARVYDHIPTLFGNALWMQTRAANALYHAERFDEAAEKAGRLNEIRPTPATLLIEARARRKRNDYQRAKALYQRAENILNGSEMSYAE